MPNFQKDVFCRLNAGACAKEVSLGGGIELQPLEKRRLMRSSVYRRKN